MMSNILKLYNTFTKTLNNVQLQGRLITSSPTNELIHGSLYVCGPTVYSDSHLGHALTYIRADLLRRFMKNFFNVNLITVMNITDIDDKIIAATHKQFSTKKALPSEPAKHPFNQVSEQYYRSFLDDMRTIRVQPPDLSVKVSKHVPQIIKYIQQLEKNNHAYVASNGDVNFSVNSVKNYIGRVDPRQKSGLVESKKDQRDFALWKAAKPNEPVWIYKDISGNEVAGRPGWHVQCSAISNAVFGSELDIHFGGKDLIFPHHYNEEACCCAFNNLDTSNTLHVWSKNWLHSGHLVMKEQKMSKSLGNVVVIKNFIDNTSINALRLLCVANHYRSDLIYDQDLMDTIMKMDHKLSAFISFLSTQLKILENDLSISGSGIGDTRLMSLIRSTHNEILEGLCDDFDTGRGLQSILALTKEVYSTSTSELKPCEIVALWQMIKQWCYTCGLQYGPIDQKLDDSLLDLLQDFRQQVRQWALIELKDKSSQDEKQSILKLLTQCDKLRAEVDELGFVIRDNKLK